MTMQNDIVAVSVIIPTYNRKELLERAIKSVLLQTFSLPLEIIVANDAGENVEPLISGLNTQQKRIILVNTVKKSGVSVARNLALSKAQGKYIAYLDDDDYYYPEHIELLYNYLEKNKGSVVYSDSLQAEQENINGIWVTVKTEMQLSEDFNADRLLVGNYIPTLNIMHAKECLEKSGAFDENLKTHEDWDLWIRLSMNYTFKHIKQVTAEYTVRPIEEKERKVYRSDFANSRKIIYDKYAEYVKDKHDIKISQQKIVEQEQLSREIGEQVLFFMQKIKEKLRANDIKGALEYYKQNRPSGDAAINAELARIDNAMQSLLK